MARERPLRRPLDHWVQAFRGWMNDLGVVGSFQASIVFVYRRVAGTLDAEVPFDEVLREAPRHPGFAADEAARGRDPDDHIDPRNLGPVSRPAFREAFRVIERAQRALALELGLRPR